MLILASFRPEDSIEKAFIESTDFAINNNVDVKFSYNGVDCFASHLGNYRTGISSYYIALRDNTRTASNL